MLNVKKARPPRRSLRFVLGVQRAGRGGLNSSEGDLVIDVDAGGVEGGSEVGVEEGVSWGVVEEDEDEEKREEKSILVVWLVGWWWW